MMGWFSRRMLQLLGWKVRGDEPLRALDQFVVAIGPHTSNWDFPLGILVRWATGLEKIHFIGKASLFRPPFGWLFRVLGGYPVERSASLQQVERYAALFREKREFAIVIAPEGTRKRVARLKSGYYHIARMAGVPIVPATIDYPSRTVHFHQAFMPGEKPEEDMAIVEEYISSAKGKYPELAFRRSS
ncbi:MAG: hypothetical protein JPMHGGIA_00569 [Saprospiraceae bacterium]|nr:hypothetical protein [Saprospiraceae bacterium]